MGNASSRKVQPEAWSRPEAWSPRPEAWSPRSEQGSLRPESGNQSPGPVAPDSELVCPPEPESPPPEPEPPLPAPVPPRPRSLCPCLRPATPPAPLPRTPTPPPTPVYIYVATPPDPPPPFKPPFKPFTKFPTPALLKEAQYRFAAEEHELVERDGEVVPCPPSWSKFCYRNRGNFTWVDKAAKKVRMDLSVHTLSEVAKYLTSDLWRDIDMVRSLFVWIASQRAKNYSMSSDLDSGSALYKLLLARNGRYFYNTLLMELCECVDIRCILVNGAVKGSTYQHGEKLTMTNTWCLVLIDGFWGLIDQNWGSVRFTGGTKKDWKVDVTDIDGYEGEQDEQHHFVLNEDYFLPPPYQFIYDHFPEKSEYQLLPRPVSKDEFRRMARIKNAYFHQNIVDLSQPECCLSTDTGEIKLEFVLREDSYHKFNFVLYKSDGVVTHPEGENNLRNSVLILNDKDRRTVHIEFEYTGTYQLELIVTDVKKNPSMPYILGTYLIKCTRPQFLFDPPIVDPDNPEIGPGADWKVLRIKDEKQSGILEAKDGKIRLNLLHDNNDGMEYSFELLGHDIPERLRRTTLYQRDSDGTKLYVRLSRHGKHLLKVHTKENESLPFRNTCNYMVKSDERCVESLFFPDSQFPSRIGQVGKYHHLEPISHPHAMFSVGETQQSLDLTMKKLLEVDVTARFHLSTDEHTEDVSEYARMHESDEDVSFDLKIPRHGMYNLTILTRPHSSSADPSISWHYVIDAAMPSPGCLPFPRRHESWSSRFLLHSPLHGILEENTEVDVDIEMADAAQVYAIQEDSSEKSFLNETSTGRFSGTVKTVSCSPLHIMAVFRGEKGENESKEEEADRKEEPSPGRFSGRERTVSCFPLCIGGGEKGEGGGKKDEKESKGEDPDRKLLEYRIVSSQDYEAVLDEAKEFVQKAIERREELQKDKKKEEEDAKQRKEEAMVKAREDERIFEEEKRRLRALELNAELQKALEAGAGAKIESLVQKYADENLEDKDGILERARPILERRKVLLKAVESRDPGEICAALDRLVKEGYETKLKVDILKAKKGIRSLKDATFKKLEIPSKHLTRLHSFQEPSGGVSQHVEALMLMFGENEDRSKSWNYCRTFLAYRDVHEEIGSLKIRAVPPVNAARIIEIVEKAGADKSQSGTFQRTWLMDCYWKLKALAIMNENDP